MTPEESFLVRKTITDLETHNSQDPSKRLGGYLVNMTQYHLDSHKKGNLGTSLIAVAVTPAAQALIATIRDSCHHLMNNSNVNEIHILHGLEHYMDKYYAEASDDLRAVFNKARSLLS